jgi:valyl-tRNA synthetase
MVYKNGGNEINKKFKIIDPKKLPKRFDFTDKELFWRNIWEEKNIYSRKKNLSREKSFVIDSPPPTVSGSLHVGHIFSYTHQDIIARYKRMQNFNVLYPMGWDDNGLPTERRVQNIFGVRIDNNVPYIKNLNVSKEKKIQGIDESLPLVINRQNFIEMCHIITEKDELVFKDLFRRMGFSIDWQDEYATIDKKSRNIAQLSFLDLYKKNHIYQFESPTMWDIDFQTAVAQAEIEDREISGAYHDIKFGIENSESGIIISTTRPELLASCVGITAHPNDKRYKHLFGKTAISPVFFAPIPIFPSELVDMEKGTGILMVCTFGDQTDVLWWRENSLPLRQLFGSDGRILDIKFQSENKKENWISKKPEIANDNINKIKNKSLKQTKKIILEMLKINENSNDNNPALIAEPKNIQHPVRFYEKGDSPIEYISSRQWFVKIIDKKEQLLKIGNSINWHPDYMSKRFENWTKNLSIDWCISRQRFFGVPIPIWYKLDDKSEIIFDSVLLPNKDNLPIDPEIDCPEGFNESERGKPNGFIGETDVFDTWFTSSLTPQIVANWGLEGKDEMESVFPMDIRPQSHEIIRTWAFYTIVKSLLHNNSIPWKNVVISGWILDPDRKKMSKSKGNVITPIETIEKYGSDSVRYWAASARLGTDTTYDENVFIVGNKLVNKLYNAAKFVLSHESEEIYDLKDLDASFIEDLKELVKKVTNYYDKFQFAQGLQITEEFFWNTYTDNYLELVKKRVFNSTGDEKNSAVTSLRLGLSVMLRLLSPVLPTITDEIWSWCFSEENNSLSIHESSWPNEEDFLNFSNPATSNLLEIAMKGIRSIRQTKTLEGIGLGKPVEKIKISSKKNNLEALDFFIDDFSNASGCYDFIKEESDDEEFTTEIIIKTDNQL